MMVESAMSSTCGEDMDPKRSRRASHDPEPYRNDFHN